MEINDRQEQKEQKKPNKFVAFLKRVFVHNIGWKILAIASALLICVLSAGLTGPSKKQEETKPEDQEPTAFVRLASDDAMHFID